jgi:high-affinity iron transporter
VPRWSQLPAGWVALVALATAACTQAPPSPAPPQPAEIEAARQISARLERIADDYPSAVDDGAVIDPTEHREQLARIAEIRERLDALEAGDPDRASADRAAIEELAGQIRDSARGAAVRERASELAGAVLARRDLVLAPLVPPDRERARAQFRENCAKCHGPLGMGDGPQAAELEVKPRNLTDPRVADRLTGRRIFTAVTDGMPAAEMPSFDLLSVDDRWALAVFAQTLRFVGPDGGVVGSPAANPPSRAELANRRNLELDAELGADGLAHARTGLVFEEPRGALAPIAGAVAGAVVKHRTGDRPEAQDHLDAAISEVFAPLRPGLIARDRPTAWRLESELYALRQAIPDGAAAALEQRAHAVLALLGPAETELEQVAAIALAGVAGLAGLGWIVVLVLCVAAAARASGFHRVGRAVHLGWAIAAIAGAATLLFAGGEVDLEAASQRHMLVAVLRLLAAIAAGVAALALARRLAVPVSVQGDASDPTPWWLALVVFAVGYGGTLEVTANIGRISAATGAGKIPLLIAAVVVLAAVATLLRLLAEARRRLGEAPFFGVTAALSMLAAIALVGQAAHGLIDSGALVTGPISGPRFDPIALYPTATTGLAQLAVAALIAGGVVFLLISRRAAVRDGAV